MWARNGASLSWPRALCLAFVGLAAQSIGAQVASIDESAERYVRDGRAQFARLDYSGARHSLESAVAIIERESGGTSPALVEPLTALSKVLVAMQQPTAASESLRRAIAIVRRSDGLYGERQYALLRDLVDLDSEGGRLDAAKSSLKQMRRVSERMQATSWQAHARSLGEIADWECRVGDFIGGRRTYRAALDALESRNDEVLLVDTLVGFARCCLQELSAEGVATAPGAFERYRGHVQRTERMNPTSPAFRHHVSRVLRWEGERALRQAAAIAESGRLDPERSLAVLLQAGDWFQTKDHYRAARDYYSSAEKVAASLRASSPLAAPVQVLYPLPPVVLRTRGLPQLSQADQGRFVEVEFRVHADGTVEGERVLDRKLGKSTVDEVLAALRVARYRPRFEAGRALDTEGVRLRQAIPDLK